MSETFKRVAQYIKENDRLVDLLGIEVVDVKPGYARVSLKVEKKHLNAAGVCQGGVIFTLADIAFAIASNSHGKSALAMDVSISFLKAVGVGEVVYAEAVEEYLGRNTASYLIRVFNQDGRRVALLKARAFRFEEDFPPESQ